MEKIVLENSEIYIIEPERIMYISFVGNITDDDYKEIWETGVEKAVDNNIEKFIFDQSKVGNVSFKARGWVILKMLPKIKKNFSSDIKVTVLTAKDLVNKSGVKYLTGMFEKMAGVKVNFFGNMEDAKEFLS